MGWGVGVANLLSASALRLCLSQIRGWGPGAWVPMQTLPLFTLSQMAQFLLGPIIS